jgi:hypothetical protein
MAERKIYKPNPSQSRLIGECAGGSDNSLSAACEFIKSVRQLSQGDGVLTLLPFTFILFEKRC